MEKIFDLIVENLNLIPIIGCLYLLLNKNINGLGKRLTNDIDEIKSNHFKHMEQEHNEINKKLDILIGRAEGNK